MYYINDMGKCRLGHLNLAVYLSYLCIDLQDAFVAFHSDKALVKKYLKSLLIGELAPDQPSFESNKKVSVLETNCDMTWGTAWEEKYKRGVDIISGTI